MRRGAGLGITHPLYLPCVAHRYDIGDRSPENENALPDRIPPEKASECVVRRRFCGGSVRGYVYPGGYASDEGGFSLWGSVNPGERGCLGSYAKEGCLGPSIP